MDLDPSLDAAPTDSVVAAPADFYYATLYLAPPARAAARALEAMRRAITAIPAHCSDRGVAHLKLAWWHRELDRLADGAPRHPLTRALLPQTTVATPPLDIFRDLLAAVIAELQDPPFTTRAAVLAHIAAMHGPFWQCVSGLGGAVGELPAALGRLIALTELAYQLRGLRQHRRSGALWLAGERLHAHGLDVAQVRSAQSSPAIAALLGDELAWVEVEIGRQLAALPRALRRRHAVPVTLGRCAMHALALTRADGCQVLERRIELLPMHKLWLAWRTHTFG